jgi:hypothetical protein
MEEGSLHPCREGSWESDPNYFNEDEEQEGDR